MPLGVFVVCKDNDSGTTTMDLWADRGAWLYFSAQTDAHSCTRGEVLETYTFTKILLVNIFQPNHPAEFFLLIRMKAVVRADNATM